MSNEQDIVCIFKALSDENRIRILKMLHSGEKCACKLLEEMHITQPTLSHHMKILCDCGLVNVRKDGKWNHYSLNCDTLREFQDFIGSLDCSIQTGCSSGKCDCRLSGILYRIRFWG